MSALRACLTTLCLLLPAGCGRAADGHRAEDRRRIE